MKRFFKQIADWKAFRCERRRALERARQNALLMSVGGTITSPKTRR